MIMLTKLTVLSQYYRLPTPYSDFPDCPRQLSLIVSSSKSKSKPPSHTAFGCFVSHVSFNPCNTLKSDAYCLRTQSTFSLKTSRQSIHHPRYRSPRAQAPMNWWWWWGVFRLLLRWARTDYGWFNVQEGSCWKICSFSFQVSFVLNLD